MKKWLDFLNTFLHLLKISYRFGEDLWWFAEELFWICWRTFCSCQRTFWIFWKNVLDSLKNFLHLPNYFLDSPNNFLDLLENFLDLPKSFLYFLRNFLDFLKTFLNLLKSLLDFLKNFLDLLKNFLDFPKQSRPVYHLVFQQLNKFLPYQYCLKLLGWATIGDKMDPSASNVVSDNGKCTFTATEILVLGYIFKYLWYFLGDASYQSYHTQYHNQDL